MRRFLQVVAGGSWVLGTLTIWHVGMFYAALFAMSLAGSFVEPSWWLAACYTLPVLSIIAAHEFGHWFAAKDIGLEPLLPTLLPWPVAVAAWLTPWMPPLGIAGAFVPVGHVKGLLPLQRFDIAWAGVMAGAVVTLLWMVVGALLSHPLPGVHVMARQYEPAIISALTGPGPVAWHPILAAARVGWLLTAVNLFTPLPLSDGWRMFSALPEAWAARRSQVLALAGVCLACGW